MQLQESREAKSAIIPAVGASGKLLVEEPAASSASAEEVEPNTQTGYGPVEAKAAVSATEGETPFEFGVEANYRLQNQVEDLELLQLNRLQWAASEKLNREQRPARRLQIHQVEDMAASITSAEPIAQTGNGPVEAKAAESATEGDTPFEFGVKAKAFSQNAPVEAAALEELAGVETAAAKALQGTTPKQAKANVQSANSSATTHGDGKARDITSSSSSEVKYNIEAAALLANVKADANEQMKEDEIYAQTGEASVQAIAAASASEEGKIPAINAQTGKGPILPNAPVGAAAAASASVYSSAAGGDDNEVLGNTL
jgi:hypothetical protein